MDNKQQIKAWRKAMRRHIDKGQNPVATIDGTVQFLQNHIDGGFLSTSYFKAMEQALNDIRRANEVIDTILADAGHTRYYEVPVVGHMGTGKVS